MRGIVPLPLPPERPVTTVNRWRMKRPDADRAAWKRDNNQPNSHRLDNWAEYSGGEWRLRVTWDSCVDIDVVMDDVKELLENESELRPIDWFFTPHSPHAFSISFKRRERASNILWMLDDYEIQGCDEDNQVVRLARLHVDPEDPAPPKDEELHGWLHPLLIGKLFRPLVSYIRHVRR